MDKKTVLVADPISPVGIDNLLADPDLEVDVRIGISPEDLLADAAQYDGIIVRSQTKITAEVLEKAKRLQAVGRAGVGVDNIDIAAASDRGVVVMNTPSGNTISTAEHAFTLMMSLARRIPQAHASIVEGRWERKKFQGVELYDKTLAILGMGRIGTEFARRAMAFGMRVVAYDPYLSANRARLLRVELSNTVEEAIREADFITMHMPMTAETQHMLNAERIKLLKPDCRIVNCARGGLIDEQALLEALREERIGGVALDVFEVEPPAADYELLQFPNVVFTPHLGASTDEAQENVGIEIAQTIASYLKDGTVVNSVNMPSIDEKTLGEIGPYLKLAESLGRLLSQTAPSHAEKLTITYAGKVSELETSLISRAALSGFLQKTFGKTGVNYINVPGLAKNLGLEVAESTATNSSEYTEVISLRVKGESLTREVVGTLFAGVPRIVRLDGIPVEVKAEGHLLMLRNTDTPGMIATIGRILGDHQINIAHMFLSRETAGGQALTVLSLDSRPEESVLKELEDVSGIKGATAVDL
ncbi:MAG: phosphoglycerate dehydrogenase [Verrucomicrobiota bacterium]